MANNSNTPDRKTLLVAYVVLIPVSLLVFTIDASALNLLEGARITWAIALVIYFLIAWFVAPDSESSGSNEKSEPVKSDATSVGLENVATGAGSPARTLSQSKFCGACGHSYTDELEKFCGECGAIRT